MMSGLIDIINFHRPVETVPTYSGEVKGVKFKYYTDKKEKEVLTDVVTRNIRAVA